MPKKRTLDQIRKNITKDLPSLKRGNLIQVERQINNFFLFGNTKKKSKR